MGSLLGGLHCGTIKSRQEKNDRQIKARTVGVNKSCPTFAPCMHTIRPCSEARRQDMHGSI